MHEDLEKFKIFVIIAFLCPKSPNTTNIYIIQLMSDPLVTAAPLNAKLNSSFHSTDVKVFAIRQILFASFVLIYFLFLL